MDMRSLCVSAVKQAVARNTYITIVAAARHTDVASELCRVFIPFVTLHHLAIAIVTHQDRHRQDCLPHT